MAATPVVAWNNTGHEVVALLAYEALDEATRTKVLEILMDHPHFAEYLSVDISPGAERGKWIFMKAATWSDWIRSGPPQRTKYHRGPWHYVNKLYIVADDAETEAKIKAKFDNPNTNRGEILKVIPECVKMIGMPAASPEEREERAVRLCWLFHLVGDLHQPLHAVARCTKELPDGDQGANLVWVTRRGDGEPRRLHMVWDNMLGNFSAYQAVTGLAGIVKRKIRFSDAERQITDPAAWAEESLHLAKSNGYNFRGKPIDLVISTDVKGPATAPRLPEEYESEGSEVARRRVALAAARLADLLKTTLAPESCAVSHSLRASEHIEKKARHEKPSKNRARTLGIGNANGMAVLSKGDRHGHSDSRYPSSQTGRKAHVSVARCHTAAGQRHCHDRGADHRLHPVLRLDRLYRLPGRQPGAGDHCRAHRHRLIPDAAPLPGLEDRRGRSRGA
jgi:hypothetical protein